VLVARCDAPGVSLALGVSVVGLADNLRRAADLRCSLPPSDGRTVPGERPGTGPPRALPGSTQTDVGRGSVPGLPGVVHSAGPCAAGRDTLQVALSLIAAAAVSSPAVARMLPGCLSMDW
jgi:hypothetical protein